MESTRGLEVLEENDFPLSELLSLGSCHTWHSMFTWGSRSWSLQHQVSWKLLLKELWALGVWMAWKKPNRKTMYGHRAAWPRGLWRLFKPEHMGTVNPLVGILRDPAPQSFQRSVVTSKDM